MGDPVTPRDVFALVARTVGLLLAVWGFINGLSAAMDVIGFPMDAAEGAAGRRASAAVVLLASGLLLLAAARPLTRWVYGSGP